MKTIKYIDRATSEIMQEIVPGENWLKWLYHKPFGKIALSAVVCRKALSFWYGRYMDSASSVQKIPSFVDDLSINMNEALLPISDYRSFNEFFIRQLKPDARPVDESANAVVSPADGKVVAFEGITGFDRFFVKGQTFSLSSFLNDEDLARQFEGGSLLIFRLAPADYHRFHFPLSGQVSATKEIKGFYYSVSPFAVKDRLRIYWENKREYSVLTTDIAGDVLICEVGATMVGTIIQTHEANTKIQKGQEKGYFKFGGSTVILLFEKGKITIDADVLGNTHNGYETTIKMGEHIATAVGVSS